VGTLLAGVLTLGLMQQLRTPMSPEDAALFAQLEDMWNEAHLHRDTDLLARLLAHDSWVKVPGMRWVKRADALSALGSAQVKFERYATSDISMHRSQDCHLVNRGYESCVVVTGRLQRSRAIGGRLLDDDWRFIKVYVSRSKGWQVVAFQATETRR
jgi:hypothetical protein